jgi:serine protease AprX
MRASSSARPLGAVSLALIALATAGVSAAPTTHQAPLRTVIVQGPGDVARAVQHAGGTILRRIPLVHGVVARMSATSLPGYAITLDRQLSVTGKKDASVTGTAVTARAALGLGAPNGQGAGVTVAVVDTGVADVPELAGRLQHVDVTGDGVGDGYGHGTFVAGLVAGSTLGVAPGAQILDVRVGHNDGSTSLIDVMAGLQAVSENPDVRVVNLALSTDGEVPPLTDALDALWAQGDTVVVPAGNDGPDRGTVTSPGTDPTLLTVGALDGSAVATWSSRGGGGPAKPDLVAPGAHLLSAGLPGSVIWTANPAAQRPGTQFVGSGTSFSTAVAAGAAAVLLAGHPAVAPDQVKSLVMKTASKVSGSRDATGAGGLDLTTALTSRVGHGSGSGSGSSDGSGDGDSSWDASSWSARQWSARQWSARQWADAQWAARQWSARQWSARQWSARQWSDSSWE